MTARADLTALGANAVFNPHILARSNIADPMTGKRLHEQVSVNVVVDVDGIDNYQGSTSITGHGYLLYDGPHRSDYAACLIESSNVPFALSTLALRAERGKWRQRMVLRAIFEDLPEGTESRPCERRGPRTAGNGLCRTFGVRSTGHRPGAGSSESLSRTIAEKRCILTQHPTRRSRTSSGRPSWGMRPQRVSWIVISVHHRVRNLVILGSGVFPTGSPANPTLTVTALSLWSANHLFGSKSSLTANRPA